jgi:hypothetical protein
MEHPSYEDLTQWCGGRGLPRCLVVGDLGGRELQRVVLHHCNVRPADWAEGVLARSIPSPIPIKVEGRGWERCGFDTTRLNSNGTPQVSYMRDLLGGTCSELGQPLEASIIYRHNGTFWAIVIPRHNSA